MEVCLLRSTHIGDLCLSPDGNYVVFDVMNKFELFSMKSNKILLNSSIDSELEEQDYDLMPHNYLSCLVFSSDSKYLAKHTYNDVKIIELDTLKIHTVAFKHQAMCDFVVLRFIGHKLIHIQNREMLIYDMSTLTLTTKRINFTVETVADFSQNKLRYISQVDEEKQLIECMIMLPDKSGHHIERYTVDLDGKVLSSDTINLGETEIFSYKYSSNKIEYYINGKKCHYYLGKTDEDELLKNKKFVYNLVLTLRLTGMGFKTMNYIPQYTLRRMPIVLDRMFCIVDLQMLEFIKFYTLVASGLAEGKNNAWHRFLCIEPYHPKLLINIFDLVIFL